jgi:hypothetical protein
MIDSKRFQDTIHRFIELYGDRIEGIADEIYAGLAWIDETKFVLIGGDEDAALKPPTWRRVSRLFNLAQQLRRPVLLWDTPFQADMAAPTFSLHARNTAQNTQRHLLKLTVPVIGVFDKLSLTSDVSPIDAALLLPQVGIKAGPLADETFPTLIKVSEDTSQLKSDILELLSHLSSLPAETLVQQRLEGIRQSAVKAE